MSKTIVLNGIYRNGTSLQLERDENDRITVSVGSCFADVGVTQSVTFMRKNEGENRVWLALEALFQAMDDDAAARQVAFQSAAEHLGFESPPRP